MVDLRLLLVTLKAGIDKVVLSLKGKRPQPGWHGKSANLVGLPEGEVCRRDGSRQAQAIKIKAMAQADAYKQIAEQIGKSNAALIELLKIVGEQNIQITPRIMVQGESSHAGATTALVGTMLDRMLTDDEKTGATKK